MSRRISALLAPPFATEIFRGAHVIAIDVLRATTTIATALANGAAGVIPVLDPEDALSLAKRLGRDRVLLCGERDSRLIPGFDLDNSPASYRPEVVGGKTLVFTTTNGTRALRVSGTPASVRAAALVNRRAIADALLRDQGDIVLLCAGVHGRFALEDALGAGALVDALLASNPTLEIDDGARAAALLFRGLSAHLAEAVASAEHAQTLAAAGFAADVPRCAALDTLSVVPTLREGILVSDGAPHREVEGTDAAASIARAIEEELPRFRERHGNEYRVRGNVNGSLLAGALQAFTVVAFRERRGDETVATIADVFEDALAAGAPGAADLVESFLEGSGEWPESWRDTLRRALGARSARLLSAMRVADV